MHPADVVQVIDFPERRQLGELDPRQWAAGGFADPRQDMLSLRTFLILGHDQP
jgi:hypothetical protein